MGNTHLIMISLDTLRSDCIGKNPFSLWRAKYPHLREPSTTPLDMLASQGAFFPNVISAAPYTTASHASIFTGMWPLHHGVHEFYSGRIDVPTVFSYGKAAGRDTVLKVDFPVILSERLGFLRDVDTYLVEDDNAFIDAVTSSSSAVACAHFGSVHFPYGFHNLKFGGADYRRKVDQLESLIPDGVPEPLDQLTETYRTPEDAALLRRYKRVIHHLYVNGEYDTLLQLYFDGVTYFMEKRFTPFLERLLERLSAGRRNYVLAVFADHGHDFDDRTFGNFSSMNEAVLRIPLILTGDEITPQTRAERLRSIDILPTLLELCGIPRAGAVTPDGCSVTAHLRDKSLELHDLPALAQAYVADLRSFVHYQRAELAGRLPADPLRHVLFSEAAYLDQARVTRTFFEYGDAEGVLREISPELTFECFGPDLVPQGRPVTNSVALMDLLDSYSRSRPQARAVTVPDDIRQALRDSGYAV